MVRTTRPVPTTTWPNLDGSLGLAASVRQFREDDVARRLQIQLALSPRAELPGRSMDVESVQLVWPGLTVVAPTVHPVKIVPGQRLDVPTEFGSGICETPSGPEPSSGWVVATVRQPPDGPTITVNAPLLDDAGNALSRIFDLECATQRLERRVGVAVSSPWVRSDSNGIPSADAQLVVTRREEREPMVVVATLGSVLLSFQSLEPLGAPVSTLEARTAELRLPVRVTATGRCDGHALAESKKTFDFRVTLAIGADEPIGASLVVSEPDRALLQSVIADTCGRAAGP